MNDYSKTKLLIKSKIWKNELKGIINYNEKNCIKTKIKINSSGVLSRVETNVTFSKGDTSLNTPFELLSIKRDTNEKYIIHFRKWTNDLTKIFDLPQSFMVFARNNNVNLDNYFINRYYKLSQGDIIKIGKMYFKVLDMYINEDKKSDSENNTIQGQKVSESNSMIVNGQEIIKGSLLINKKNFPMNYSSRNLRVNNNSLNPNNIKIDNSYATLRNHNRNSQKNGLILPKVCSFNDLFSIKKKTQNTSTKFTNLINSYRNNKKKSSSSNNDENSQITKKNKKISLNTKSRINSIIKKPKTCRICYGDDSTNNNPLLSPCNCKGSMKYIHYLCLKNWLNSKIEEDIVVNEDNEIPIITYNRKDINCELCKSKLPDYVKYNGAYFNICFYKPKFKEFVVLESVKSDKQKTKNIHMISFDNKTFVNIGRATECELCLDDTSVSRYHCIIHKDDGNLFLEDNNSKYGTLVLIQNQSIVLNEIIPLKLQINNTYIKIKMELPFFFNCCNSITIDSKLDDYQIQNEKYLDVFSCFIIKENNIKDEDDDEKEQNNENVVESIEIKNIKKEKNESSLLEDQKNEASLSEKSKNISEKESLNQSILHIKMIKKEENDITKNKEEDRKEDKKEEKKETKNSKRIKIVKVKKDKKIEEPVVEINNLNSNQSSNIIKERVIIKKNRDNSCELINALLNNNKNDTKLKIDSRFIKENASKSQIDLLSINFSTRNMNNNMNNNSACVVNIGQNTSSLRNNKH